MIENMRVQRPVFSPVDREARDTDRVVFDYRARIGGKAFEGSDLTDVRIVLGTRQAMPELEEALKGVRAGDERVVHAAFPATHPNKKLAGQSAELHLSIKAVEEHSLPAVDDEFFRAYGVEQGGIAEMRAEVRKSMERELAEVIRSRVRVQILDALYRDNPVELPRALLEEAVQELQVDTARRFGVRDVSRLPPRESFEEPARRRVALGLLIVQIAQSQGLKLERERVQARLGQLTESYPDPEEARRAYLRSPEAMRTIESAVLEEQVVNFLLEHAQATERRLSFSDLTGFGRGRAGEEPPHQHEPRHDPHDDPQHEPHGEPHEASGT
jgi:trigger factor